jgi:hypothetical protein
MPAKASKFSLKISVDALAETVGASLLPVIANTSAVLSAVAMASVT